jgi:phosphate transport system protein
MPMLLQKELEKLKKQILSLGAMVEEQFNMAIKAVETKDRDMAIRTIESDRRIDEIEVEVEEECLKVLALHQPVAVDLRFIVAVIKINNDAERVAYIASRPNVPVRFDYRFMAEKTKLMLNQSLDSLVNLDVDLAYKVRLQDDEVDAVNREIYEQIREVIRKYPERGGYLINLFSISRHLERIADHATNIAEEVIYMVEGVIKRHPKSQKSST